MKFETIISPVSYDEFNTKYFRKGVYYLKGQTEKYDSLFSWDSLNEILEFQQFGVTRLNLVKKGERFTDIYNYETPKFPNMPSKPILKIELIKDELKTGAVLVINSINQMLPTVKELTDSFQWLYQIQSQVNLYMSGKFAEGFNMHWDSHDVFILQVQGEKYWEVYKPTINFPVIHSLESEKGPCGLPLWSGILSKGDLLYIPRGYWHKANTQQAESIHLTLGIHSRTGLDYADWFKAQLINDEVFRKDILITDDKNKISRYAKEVKEALNKSINRYTVQKYFDFIDKLNKHNKVNFPTSIDIKTSIAIDGNTIKVNSVVPLKIKKLNRKEYTFVLEEKKFIISSDINAALKVINSCFQICFEDLCKILRAEYSKNDVRKIVHKLAVDNLITIITN